MYVDCRFTFSPPSSWMLYLVRLLRLLYCLQRWWTSRQGALSPGPLQQGLLQHYFDLAFEASLLVEASVTAASAGLPFQGSEDLQLCSPVYWKFLQIKLQIFIFKNLKKTALSKIVHFVQRTYQHTCCIVFLYILITEHMFLSLPCKEGPKTGKSLVLYIALKHISSILFHERERKWVRTYFCLVRNAFKFRLFR